MEYLYSFFIANFGLGKWMCVLGIYYSRECDLLIFDGYVGISVYI